MSEVQKDAGLEATENQDVPNEADDAAVGQATSRPSCCVARRKGMVFLAAGLFGVAGWAFYSDRDYWQGVIKTGSFAPNCTGCGDLTARDGKPHCSGSSCGYKPCRGEPSAQVAAQRAGGHSGCCGLKPEVLARMTAEQKGRAGEAKTGDSAEPTEPVQGRRNAGKHSSGVDLDRVMAEAFPSDSSE